VPSKLAGAPDAIDRSALPKHRRDFDNGETLHNAGTPFRRFLAGVNLALLTGMDLATHSGPIANKVRIEAHGSSNSFTIPPELMVEAAWRLGWLGLIYAAGGVVVFLARRAALTSSGDLAPVVHIGDAAAGVSIAAGVAMYLLYRQGGLTAKRLLDLGLVFEVVAAFGISAGQFWTGHPGLPPSSLTLIPAECLWIVLFPLVVPTTPGKLLASSLLAASAGPVMMASASWWAGVPLASPLALASYFLPNYWSVVIAYAISRIVHRYAVRLHHAREIGSYQLIERIGEGGMGEVWRAEHRLLARPAAIKLIRADILGSNVNVRAQVVRRFEREAQDTATLGSPHTIDVYDFGVTEDGDFYYVMELLHGISLQTYVEVFGPMEPPRVAYLLDQVAHSLSEAHARNLVHRDIKPANIFTTRLGLDYDFIKVLDFGLVKHVAPSGPAITLDGSAAGTPEYMAPEIALGHGVDARADIYALGCVAYYLLTGQPVFAGDTPLAAALAHVQDRPVAPSLRSEFAIPAAVDALILATLDKDPSRRPASAAEFASRLGATIGPNERWTGQSARSWWELHQATIDGRDASAVAASSESTKPRVCRPQLDRESDLA
jgi:serine/threonine protein kinase